MKKIFLIMIVLLILGGCGVKGEDAVLPDMAEVVAESEDTSFSGSEISEEKNEVVDIVVDNVEKPKTDSEEKKVTVVQKKSEVKENTSSGSKNKTEVEKEVSTDEERAEVKPDETEIEEVTEEPTTEVIETPSEPEKEEEPKVDEKPKRAYDYDFDMAKIRSDCIAIGKYMGLKHDSSLTPDNATWWNPVTASESNQGKKLKNRLESYIRFHTIDNLSSYGIDEINYFNIYTEQVGEGKYKIYFLFA
ncbi:MAG: hypothetical protein IKM61_03805 [Eubacteriaceae bacterium]|nr:hypothetical protein [Eubacteriaceae bacterium]